MECPRCHENDLEEFVVPGKGYKYLVILKCPDPKCNFRKETIEESN